jgi:ribulose kinase
MLGIAPLYGLRHTAAASRRMMQKTLQTARRMHFFHYFNGLRAPGSNVHIAEAGLSVKDFDTRPAVAATLWGTVNSVPRN